MARRAAVHLRVRPDPAVYLPGEEQPHKLAGIYNSSDLLNTIGANSPTVTAAR